MVKIQCKERIHLLSQCCVISLLKWEVETMERFLFIYFFVVVVVKAFYAPEGTSGGILKSHRPSVRPLQIVSQRYLINC